MSRRTGRESPVTFFTCTPRLSSEVTKQGEMKGGSPGWEKAGGVCTAGGLPTAGAPQRGSGVVKQRETGLNETGLEWGKPFTTQPQQQ